MPKIPFYRPVVDAEQATALISEALQNHWLTTGPLTKRFEQELSSFLKTESLVLLNSATAALQLALRLAGIGPGDEVIVPAVTFIATLETVVLAGATPVLADIDFKNFNLSANALQHLCTGRTKAIIFVPMAGNASGIEQVRAFCDKNNIRLILDNAHALETTWKDQFLHNCADYSCYSFYATKNLTSAEGGALIMPAEQKERARALTLHGMSREAWSRYQGGSWRYDITDFGYKYNLTDIHSALALVQMPHLEKQKERRQAITQRYRSRLQQLPWLFLQETTGEMQMQNNAFHLFLCVLADNAPVDRETLFMKFAQAEIGYSVHFIPLYEFTAVQKAYGFRAEDYPKSQKYFKGAFSLPLYPSLHDNEIDYICDTICQLQKG